MPLKYINNLLVRSFQKEPDYQRLDRLESDVWARIQQSKIVSSQASVWTFSLWSGAQLRYASLALVLVAGLMTSQLSTAKAPSDTLGLEVFAMNAPYMISSTLSNPDRAPS